MSEQNNNGLDLVFNAGVALSAVRDIHGQPFVVVPDGFQVENLSHMLNQPTRLRGKATLSDEGSFIGYVNLHKTDATDLYYSVNPPSFKAVFNSNRPGQPGWCDFSAVYRCPLSPAWMVWTQNDGKRMDQESFARFIEANLPDIVEPENAQMLEIALTLEAKKKVNFVSGLRLTNGSNEFTYEEQVDGSAAKGKLKIPEKISLGIPVFLNGDPYKVEANFRYRIGDGGKLQMWYELVRPHVIIDDAVANLRDKIVAETGLTAWNGDPF